MKRTHLLGAIAITLALALTGCAPRAAHTVESSKDASTPRPTATTTPFHPLSATAISALPADQYDAVIPGLIPFTEVIEPNAATQTYTLSQDAALYGADKITPVARLARLNFLEQPTTVVVVKHQGPWALILTPARKELPSKHVAGGPATPAQTSAWVRSDQLVKGGTAASHIVVSIGARQLKIVDSHGTATQSFSIGVGTPGTPTPSDVTGYIQARYVDPAQGTGPYPINLTTLHSAAADEPFGGHDGGLVGIHYFADTSGAVSHGCLRLPAPAINAVNALALGTLVTITP